MSVFVREKPWREGGEGREREIVYESTAYAHNTLPFHTHTHPSTRLHPPHPNRIIKHLHTTRRASNSGGHNFMWQRAFHNSSESPRTKLPCDDIATKLAHLLPRHVPTVKKKDQRLHENYSPFEVHRPRVSQYPALTNSPARVHRDISFFVCYICCCYSFVPTFRTWPKKYYYYQLSVRIRREGRERMSRIQ